jgi:hypothetical protein
MLEYIDPLYVFCRLDSLILGDFPVQELGRPRKHSFKIILVPRLVCNSFPRLDPHSLLAAPLIDCRRTPVGMWRAVRAAPGSFLLYASTILQSV